MLCYLSLSQIALYNVLDNAVKFSQPQHEIIIRPFKKQSVEIVNTGSRFSNEALQNIFELFSCGYEPVDQNFGLGLSITKMVTELQGGRVEAFNLPTGQACVRLHFQPNYKKPAQMGHYV
jgi:K+-sensing histidine kinase KdpD